MTGVKNARRISFARLELLNLKIKTNTVIICKRSNKTKQTTLINLLPSKLNIKVKLSQLIKQSNVPVNAPLLGVGQDLDEGADGDDGEELLALAPERDHQLVHRVLRQLVLLWCVSGI